MPDHDSPFTVALLAVAQGDRDIVADLLSQYQGSRLDVEIIRTAAAALGAIAERRHDAYLIDAGLAGTDGEVVSMAAATGRPLLLVDDAQRRAVEDRRREACKMEALARLAAGVAHDFNNLLTAMLGYAEMLRESLDPDDVRREDVLEIQRAGERASALTRQLITFGRRTPLQATPLDLNAALDGLKDELASLAGDRVQLSLQLGAGGGDARVDAARFQALVSALVSNACEATPDGGRVRIETRLVDLDDSQAAGHPGACRGPHLMLGVSDEGCGMTEEVRSHLFEPFFTTKTNGRGTGLGLPMVYGIVRQAHGHIEVESAVGRGTTVRVYWPVAT